MVAIIGILVVLLTFAGYIAYKKAGTAVAAQRSDNCVGSQKETSENSKISDNANELLSLANELTEVSNKTFITVSQVVMSISEISSGNNNVTEAIQDLNLLNQNIASSVEQINRLLKEDDQKAKEALSFVSNGKNTIANQINAAKNAFEVIQTTSISIRELKEMANNILAIIDIITSIAGQTNLIALNAAIEAARAGEHGRGFAVVSDEIRKLAESSNASAKKIADIVSNIIGKVDSVDKNMEKTLSTISVQEQSLSMTEKFFQDINDSLDDIYKNLSYVSAKVEEANSMSKEISFKSQDISAVAEETAAGTSEIVVLSEKQIDGIEGIISLNTQVLNKITEMINSLGSSKRI